ncbi:toxin-antitoxin system HicB family antitoxin [Candidatus Poribacteria bacterium]|nr:MAG: toxin-antitoxin system HicB family antitoxin [Candidatus Poribacteria bacterium]
MKKNNHDDFDGFMINVFFDEDSDYLAHLVEFPNVSAFGATPAEALAELKTAWELVKESYQAHGEPLPQAPSRENYEGPFNVPVDAQLYHALADEAAKVGVSLYALVAQKLAKPISTNNIRNRGQ